VSIHNLIRGLAPFPGARSFLKTGDNKLSFKIFESHPECKEHNFKPGFIISDGKHFMKIACDKGFLNIVCLQVEGKNRMSTVEFLRGFNISDCKVVS
jgi:methionyl-tRNA formyltransferase